MNESKLLFRQVLIDATLELADDLRDSKRVEYSAKHRKHMRSMGVSIGWSAKTKILVALIAAAILLTGCAVFREHISEFILSFGEGFINIEGASNPDAPREIQHAYVPTYIPEGFTEVERVEEWYQVKTIWENAEGKQIKLLQGTLEGTLITLYREENTYKKISSDGLNILVYKHNDKHYSCICSTHMYVFNLTVYDSLTEEAIVMIFSSLE